MLAGYTRKLGKASWFIRDLSKKILSAIVTDSPLRTARRLVGLSAFLVTTSI
jgi:hypothetical protein